MAIEAREVQIEQLIAQVRGNVVTSEDDAYQEACHIYNRNIDRHPAVFLYCANEADVITGLRFAKEHDLPLSIRSGGHSIPGFSVNDDGIVLDLSPMHNVHIDQVNLVADVGGGATWGDVDHAAWAFGLVTPGGIISTTGVAGLGLGGGFGHLSRRFGLVVDNMVSADVVTAEGELVHASEEENADLFWALRGGGGNFGIVTRLKLRLHKIPGLYGGPIFYPVSESENILRFYRDFIADAPRELSAFFLYSVAPAAPFVPEALHGHTACAIVVSWIGDPQLAEEMVRPIREAGKVALDLAGPIPYPALNSMFDDLHPPGDQHYWKADFVPEMTDDVIATHVRFGPTIANSISITHIYPMNGAIQDVPPDATAFSYRDVNFIHIIGGVDADPAQFATRREWARNYWSALHPFSAQGAYVNFMMEEGDDRIRATYRGNYQRLAQVKGKWDPENVFHLNQNITPQN